MANEMKLYQCFLLRKIQVSREKKTLSSLADLNECIVYPCYNTLLNITLSDSLPNFVQVMDLRYLSSVDLFFFQMLVMRYKFANNGSFFLSVDLDTSKQKAWWKKRKIRMHLCQIYYSEGMLEEFANTALQLVLKWVWRRTVISLYPSFI